MPRYEGMDDLLQRVRERLGVPELEEGLPVREEIRTEPIDRDRPYLSLLNCVLVLVHDAEQIEETVRQGRLTLTSEQRAELLSLLQGVMAELQRFEALLRSEVGTRG